MHWLPAAIWCRLVGHKPTLWSRPEPFVFCLRCGAILEKY